MTAGATLERKTKVRVLSVVSSVNSESEVLPFPQIDLPDMRQTRRERSLERFLKRKSREREDKMLKHGLIWGGVTFVAITAWKILENRQRG